MMGTLTFVWEYYGMDESMAIMWKCQSLFLGGPKLRELHEDGEKAEEG
jgi:hypothetical protein